MPSLEKNLKTFPVHLEGFTKAKDGKVSLIGLEQSTEDSQKEESL